MGWIVDRNLPVFQQINAKLGDGIMKPKNKHRTDINAAADAKMQSHYSWTSIQSQVVTVFNFKSETNQCKNKDQESDQMFDGSL